MTALRKIKTDQLEAELARRKAEADKSARPKPKPNPDFAGLIEWMEEHFEKRQSNDDADEAPILDDEQFQHAVYEGVIEAVYGTEFWEWSKKQPW